LKSARLTVILPAMILAACQGRPNPALTLGPAPPSAPAPGPGPVLGIDLPTDASDVLNELEGGRFAFVARYYRDPTSHWPPLSASEARRLAALGLRIVAVWEPRSPDPAHFSYSSGYADALAAYGQAQAVGQPAGSAIYFAVDFDAQALEPIEQYFTGVAAGLAAASGGKAEYRVGVYGSGAVCEAVTQAGLARYSWLSNSTAWAGSLDYRGWNIRQGGRLAELSFNHDSDEARSRYGGFRPAARDVAAATAGAAASATLQAFAR
jgi:hypothetical protein